MPSAITDAHLGPQPGGAIRAGARAPPSRSCRRAAPRPATGAAARRGQRRGVRTRDAAGGEAELAPPFALIRASSGLSWRTRPRYHRRATSGGRSQCDAAIWRSAPTRLVKRFGDRRVVDGVDIAVPHGHDLRRARPQWRGQDDDAAHAARHHRARWRARARCSAHDRPRDASDRVGYLPEERGLYPGDEGARGDRLHGRAARAALARRAASARSSCSRPPGSAMPSTTKIRKLSKGMAQLVQLLGSVVHEPDLLVLDEPFSGLDPVNQERLEALILAAARSRRDDPVLHPRHGACRAAVRPAGDHRRRQAPVRGHGGRGARDAADAARITRPHHDGDGARARCCPPMRCATATAGASPMPADGIEALLVTLIDAGLRHFGPVDRAARAARRLRPHRRRRALAAGGRGMSSVPPDHPPDADHRAARFHRDRVHARPSCCSCSRRCCMRSFGAIGGLGARNRRRRRRTTRRASS